ncbi:MAG: Mrp/NBP35 family ATP-binding protein [Bdellovibrionaceae bacterium]|jgi:ATP-binding protein involved in chromosome partitioning|nr:Mrp/NBP35 family ATP-binding protein [Pseudobdellovibrionaceae bacterium]
MAGNPFDNQKVMSNVKNIILVGSGKGGVGKSTVSCNLAVALKKCGRNVGIMDADIYGPSIPRMMGALQQSPEIQENKKITPITRYGVKMMSMGFLIEEDSAVVWRGPMLFKAIEQFFSDVEWGELDDLVIDLPPGTGDVALTIAQKMKVQGAVIVTTPQNMALIDAKKAVDMFNQVKVPLLGVVENMAPFTPAGASEPITLFPKGDLDTYLTANNIKKLSSIPFNPSVGLNSEAGVPIVEGQPDSEQAQSFMQLAKNIAGF